MAHQTYKIMYTRSQRRKQGSNLVLLAPKLIHGPCWHTDWDHLPIRSSMSCVPSAPARACKRDSRGREGGKDGTISWFCPQREAELAPPHLFRKLMDLRRVRGNCLNHSQRHIQAEPWILSKAALQCIKRICSEVWVMVKKSACLLKEPSLF